MSSEGGFATDNSIQLFQYQGKQVRTVIQDGEPWFVAKDVCDILELGNVSQTVNGNPRAGAYGLRDSEKGLYNIDTLNGGRQTMLCVSEPGLYRLIGKSRKPEAEAFQDWVYHEVLPAIRKTGMYSAKPLSDLEILQRTVAVLSEHAQKLSAVTEKVDLLNKRVDNLDAVNIGGDPRQQLKSMIDAYAFKAGIPFWQAWERFDKAFNRAYHTNIKRCLRHYRQDSGSRKMTRGDYLNAKGLLPDALRVADKMFTEINRATQTEMTW